MRRDRNGCIHSCRRSRPIDRLTNEQQVDTALAELQGLADVWRDISGKQKAKLLRDVQSRAIKAAKVMGEAAAKVNFH